MVKRFVKRSAAGLLLLAAVVLVPAFVGSGAEGKRLPPTIDDLLGEWELSAKGVLSNFPVGQLEKERAKRIPSTITKADADHVEVTGLAPGALTGAVRNGVIVLGGFFDNGNAYVSYTGFLVASGNPGKLKAKGVLCLGDETGFNVLFYLKLSGKQISGVTRRAK